MVDLHFSLFLHQLLLRRGKRPFEAKLIRVFIWISVKVILRRNLKCCALTFYSLTQIWTRVASNACRLLNRFSGFSLCTQGQRLISEECKPSVYPFNAKT